jgi:hypothetical protein
MARHHAPLLGPGQPVELPRPVRSAAPFVALAAVALSLLAVPEIPRGVTAVAVIAFASAAAVRGAQEHRELARLRSSLDRLLLRREPAMGSPLLVWRAGELSGAEERSHLVAALRRLERSAESSHLPGAAPLNRRAVRMYREQIDALIAGLSGPDPVKARGVLLVRRLLDDPGGPLYDRDRAGELERDLRNALRALDD